MRDPSHLLDAMNSPGLGADGGRLPPTGGLPDALTGGKPEDDGPPALAGAFLAGVPPPLTGGDAERAAGDTERAGDAEREGLVGIEKASTAYNFAQALSFLSAVPVIGVEEGGTSAAGPGPLCSSRSSVSCRTLAPMSNLAEGRAKRAIAPNAKQNALARLADLKKNGGRRTEQYQVRLDRDTHTPSGATQLRWQAHPIAASRCCAAAAHPWSASTLWCRQVQDDGDIYDDVDEDEYQELIRKRRDENFIEDDGAHTRFSTKKPPRKYAPPRALHP